MTIQTFNLSKRYRRRWVVRDLDLAVGAGDVFGFLGPNGAGKSTTIRMLLGLVRPTRGRAELLGHDVQRKRELALARVGAVVEAPTFYDHLTAWKNLEIFAAMSGGATRRRLSEVIDFVGLSGREREPVRVYSHGMRQRLGIAQSLLPHPQLVILDEPTDGLDPAGVVEMRKLILRLREELGLTVFMSTHMLGEVEQLCNRVAILNDGRLLFQGEVRALLTATPPTWEIVVEARTGARDAEVALQVCAQAGCPATCDGAQNVLLVRADVESIPALNAALVGAGVKVYRLGERRRRLEDAYSEMVNRRSGDDAHIRIPPRHVEVDDECRSGPLT